MGTVTNIIPDHTVTSIRQTDALGLGHAVLCATSLNDEPFAVLLPDVLVLDKDVMRKALALMGLVEAWNRTEIDKLWLSESTLI